MVMSGTPLFHDLDLANAGNPSLDPDMFKNDGIYVGEAKVEAKLKNGKYKVRIPCDGRIFQARPAHGTGETIYPSGILVLLIAYNADAFIIGRIRATKDEESSDGNVETDTSEVVGNAGDATLQPHSYKEEGNNARVTVTAGGVVAVRSTGATNITLHPHGERIIQRCQSLLSYSDGYRIESGKTSGKVGGIVLSTLTTETYKDRVGPVRTEIRVRNGKIPNETDIHDFAINSVVTAGGVTTGTCPFWWGMDSSGNWQIYSAKTIKFGSIANEPVVLGKQYVTLTKAIITNHTTLNSANIAAMAALATAAAGALTTILNMPMNPVGNFTALSALCPALTALATAITTACTTSTTGFTTLQSTYLTPLGILNEAVLSDLMSVQKALAPPIAVVE